MNNTPFLVIEMPSAYCQPIALQIYGKNADTDDFGKQEDTSPDTAPLYGCGNMRFIPKISCDDVMTKYDITKKEYDIVSHELARLLSFGECELCS